MQINLDFTGQVAICTGGASGMGLLSGQKLAASGAKVVLVFSIISSIADS